MHSHTYEFVELSEFYDIELTAEIKARYRHGFALRCCHVQCGDIWLQRTEIPASLMCFGHGASRRPPQRKVVDVRGVPLEVPDCWSWRLDGMVAPVEVLAIVPARGGSKGIPGKNIKLLDGYPLISYSIAAGLRAQFVSRVIVSTDDEEIADIASSWGAEVPFLRPPELAQDDSPDLPVFQHALRWLSEHENYRPEIIVQLRPTSPLRPVDCVDRAVEALMENPLIDSVRAVVPSGQNPYKMWLLDETRAMKPLLAGASPEPYNMPRQMLPPTYWQTGHVDVARYATIMDKNSMSGETIRPLVLESAYTMDIDTDNDWERAEWILSRSHLTIVRPLCPVIRG